MELATSVYTAFRGYSWSRIPSWLTEKLMDQVREVAAAKRGDFPDPEKVDRGVIALGPVAAAFSIRNVPNWDSNGRASEYSAFAFFKAADAARFDFVKLLGLTFFNEPTRETTEAIDYTGESSSPAPITAAGQLVCRRHLDALPSTQCGDILAKYFTKSAQWIFRANDDDTMSVDCAAWERGKTI